MRSRAPRGQWDSDAHWPRSARADPCLARAGVHTAIGAHALAHVGQRARVRTQFVIRCVHRRSPSTQKGADDEFPETVVTRLPLSISRVPEKLVPSASNTTMSATELTQLGPQKVTGRHVPTTLPPQVSSIAEHVSSPLPPPPQQPTHQGSHRNHRPRSSSGHAGRNVAESLWSSSRGLASSCAMPGQATDDDGHAEEQEGSPRLAVAMSRMGERGGRNEGQERGESSGHVASFTRVRASACADR
jgi:hypothetical protein